MSKKHAPAKAPAKPAAKKVTVVGKHPAPHKPAKVSAAVHRARTAAAKKGAATRKHNAALAKKKRGLALGEAVPCCAAEALAASLRLTGWPVGDADVLALYKLTADGPDAGASIWETLEAAYMFGLAGVRLVSFKDCYGAADTGAPLLAGTGAPVFPCLLGVDLPGPHTVLAEAGYWWSWGEPYDPAAWPGVVIEEAWEVRWAR